MRQIAIFCIMIFFIISCGKDSPTSPAEIVKETPELKELCLSIDKALEESDSESLKSLISAETLSFYESEISTNSNKLQGFAEVFASRKLLAIDNVQAVYEIVYQGKYYQISITKDDNGKWKLTDM